jgi:alkylhydroperoxidase family enzyme
MNEAVDRYRKALIDRVLRGPGTATPDVRRAAFDNAGVTRARALVDKVARCAWTITDDDVAAVKGAGLSDDQIFELTVCAAIGQATRQLDAALAAVEAAAAEPGEAP